MSISSLLFERARNHLHLNRERARLAQAFSLPRATPRPAKSRRPSFSTVEQLEQRTLMAATWTALTHPAPGQVTAMYLLPDGRVLAQGGPQQISNRWEILTPDAQGHYVDGTWSSAASSNYARLFYSSQILQDGRLFVAGSEYDENISSGPPFNNPTAVTKNAEIYNPLTNTWTMLPNQNFGALFDCASEILPDGRVLMVPVEPATPFGTLIYDPQTNTFTAGPAQLRGINAPALSGDEEGLVKLPDGSILTVDGAHTSERYIPSLNQWVNDGPVPVNLYDLNSDEIGASALLPNGKVIWFGGTGRTAIYTPSGNNNPGTWTTGPTIPGGKIAEDSPATVLADGNVLFMASASEEAAGTFYLYNPITNTITTTTQIPSFLDPPFVSRFLNLPDGTILTCHTDSQLYIYNPNTPALAAAAPVLSSIVRNTGGTFTASGTNFNGINEGSSYGDDAQMSTNYPLIRLTSGSNVYYARSFGWNMTGVVTGDAPAFTNFSLPANLPQGAYQLQVVTNGVASNAMTFINRPDATPTLVFTQQPTGGLPLRPLAPFTVTIEDQYGDIYGGFNSPITLTVASGPGTIGGTFTVSAVDGVATFSNVTLSAAGTYTLAASDPADNVFNILSDPFTVQPGPTQLVFTSQPATSIAGQPIAGPVTVTLQFANGTVVDDNTAITLAVASGPGGLNGNVTIPLVHGVATFNAANITVAGTYTLSATDPLDNIVATSNSFLVNAAAAATLAFEQPITGAIAGSPISPAVLVAIEDAYGNVISSSNANITIAVSSGPGLLAGFTSATTSSGVAAFNNLVLTTAGNYTLTATDAADNFVGTSNTFTLSPGAAANLAFLQAPSTLTAGQLFAPAVSAVLTDAFGNVATNNVSNISIAVASGPGAILGATTVPVVNGIANFNDITIKKAGTYQLVINDGGLGPVTSSAFNVNAGPPSQAVFLQQPSAITSGTRFNLVMQIEDAAGNFIGNSNAPVHLSLVGAPRGAKLNAAPTTRAVNGIVTIHNAQLTPSTGYFTLGATLPGYVTSYSAPIIVSGPPVKLVVGRQPAAVVAAGPTLTPVVVRILDNFGRTAASNSPVTVFLIGPSGAVLGGTRTVHANNGVALFSNLSISRPGTYTLRFTAGKLQPVNSIRIVVTSSNAQLAAAAKKKQAAHAVAATTKTVAKAVTRTALLNPLRRFGLYH
ncbi:MAG: hypothetical protein ACTHN5_07165 [Phycisphaerae bacterium]